MTRKARSGKYVEYEKLILNELKEAINKAKQIKQNWYGNQNNDLIDKTMVRLTNEITDHTTLVRLNIPRTSFQDVMKNLKSEELVTQIQPTFENLRDNYGLTHSQVSSLFAYSLKFQIHQNYHS